MGAGRPAFSQQTLQLDYRLSGSQRYRSRPVLAFWFVDGVLYALKDTVGSIVIVVVFGGSLLWGHPLLGAFVAQALDPRTPQQEASLERLFAERPLARTLLISTAGLVLLNGATAFAFSAWQRGISRIGANRVLVYQYLITITGVASGLIFFGEVLSIKKIVGGAIILMGVYLARRR